VCARPEFAALFSPARLHNIQSLAVGATEQKHLSRMTIVVAVEVLPARTDHQNSSTS